MPTLRSRITPPMENGARLVKTDHGSHPPEIWAQITAEHLVPITEEMTGPLRRKALALQMAVEDAILPHHVKVRDQVTAKLKSDAKHFEAEPNAEEYLDDALASIQSAAVGTDWQDQFTFGHTKPAWLDAYLEKVDELGGDNVPPLTGQQIAEKTAWERQNVVRFEVGRHFRDVQLIEKSWHKDRLDAAAAPSKGA